MKFRKIICFALAFAFAAGTIENGSISRDGLCVYAADEKEEKPGQEEFPKVIADIRKRVNIPAVANDYEWKSELQGENISYKIKWKYPKGRNELEVYYWNGLIYGYWDTSVYSAKPTLVKISPEEQEKLAMSHIRKLNPGLEGDIVLERRDDYYTLSGNVTFDIKRLEQGLYVSDNCGWITVNRDSGELQSLRLCEWWEGAEFADSRKALTREEIYDSYTSRFSQTAEYELYSAYTFDSEKDMRSYDVFALPVYKSSAVNGENFLDAFSGEYSDYYRDFKETDDSLPWDWDGAFDVGTCGGGWDYGDLRVDYTDAEKNAFKASKKGQEQISREQALKLVNDNGFIKLDSSLELVKDELIYTLDEKYDLRLLRCLKFERKARHNRADSVYLTVYLDAYTGKITKFSKSYSYGENSKTKNTTPVDEKSAVKTAKEAMNRFMGEWGREYKFEGNIAGSFTLSGGGRKEMNALTPGDTAAIVEFVRYVNGIPARFDKVYITVDSRGEALGFDYTYHDIEFPKEKMLSQREAFGKVFEKDPPGIYYTGFTDTNAKPHTYLVYSFDESYYINAITGERCTEWGKPYYSESSDKKDSKPQFYTDVSGHKYEKEIRELYKYGVRFGDDEKLRPDDPITIAEFGELCSITGVSDYETWRSYHDIKVTDPETGKTHYEDDPIIHTSLTYGELAKIFAQHYGYGDPSRYKQPYKNVTKDNPNYIYIAAAKVNGYIKSGVSFYYDKTITRGECMKLFYDYIENDERKTLYEIIQI
ncbi:MAG: S-layer homology domain-containing protein [Oscillospiraceae bacterium]|nr:S-layer homology domain-containing protein [Oscillospiraceae bacterium]